MRGWPELGVVDTIYEEEQEDEEGEGEEQDGSKYSPCITPSPTITPSPPESSSSTPLASLQSRVEAWSQATGCKPDAVIQVHDQSFHLHKDQIISMSCYLKRRLTGSSEVIIAPPLPVTAATFAEIAAFIYGSDVVLTPLNIASIRIGAECLEMEGLVGITETYLNEELAGGSEIVGIVLRSCLEMIPNAAAVAIAGRCVEALASEEGGGGGGGDGIWIEGLVGLKAEELLSIAGTMRARVSQSHDVLYRIVNHYLEHNAKLSEEEKNRICNIVDCTKLSHSHLLDLVQNPNMPLRFIVQAMLIDQLYTRQALCHRKHINSPNKNNMNMSLGEILKRDAALRQAANIKKSMEDTSFRLESLERELAGLRRRLRWPEERSESFSVLRYEEEEVVVGSPERGWKGRESNGKGLGRRLLYGLRKVFRPVLGREEDGRRWSCKGGEEMVVVLERRGGGHRRNSSFS
ncbi:Tropomyosin domain-containing protein [Dioscorea alata]|uniref:Tropomyosin domain-containing protein n=1 Tax=Dioscorea alata TaxID=55571 RepID=A0ACB7UWP8_DIOAL|nr:Tropomyosin domain-containing protein [Dioscorea alata]